MSDDPKMHNISKMIPGSLVDSATIEREEYLRIALIDTLKTLLHATQDTRIETWQFTLFAQERGVIDAEKEGA